MTPSMDTIVFKDLLRDNLVLLRDLNNNKKIKLRIGVDSIIPHLIKTDKLAFSHLI